MNIKRFIKQFTPPILVEAFRGTNVKPAPSPIWEGIYPNFSAVKLKESGFDKPDYAENQAKSTRIFLSSPPAPNAISGQTHGRMVLLPLLAATRLAAGEKKISVLEIGGGTGSLYVHLRRTLPEKTDIDYFVVETAPAVERGRDIFSNDPGIQFSTELPAHKSFDIVYIETSLQYVEDFQSFLQRICSSRPRFVFLVRLSAGQMPSFVSVQKNMPGMEMAVWFLNLDEVIRLFQRNGYELLHSSSDTEKFDMSNFPESHRMERP